MWWHVSIVPVIQEAEAGESLDPRRQRLPSAKIGLLHSSLVTKQDSISIKKKKERNKEIDTVLMVGDFVSRLVHVPV